jgi:hypothetical protein
VYPFGGAEFALVGRREGRFPVVRKRIWPFAGDIPDLLPGLISFVEIPFGSVGSWLGRLRPEAGNRFVPRPLFHAGIEATWRQCLLFRGNAGQRFIVFITAEQGRPIGTVLGQRQEGQTNREDSSAAWEEQTSEGKSPRALPA